MNKKGFINIKIIAFAVVIFILISVTGYLFFIKKLGPTVQQPSPTPTTTSQTSIPSKTSYAGLCKNDKEFSDSVSLSPECAGQDFRCVDGWSSKVYYDKRLTTITPTNESSLHLPKELKDAIIAEYGKSSCSCKNPVSYQILSDEKLKETNCENFYDFIEKYNSSCDNCVLTWETECC